jgi:hypothetical protein
MADPFFPACVTLPYLSTYVVVATSNIAKIVSFVSQYSMEIFDKGSL